MICGAWLHVKLRCIFGDDWNIDLARRNKRTDRSTGKEYNCLEHPTSKLNCSRLMARVFHFLNFFSDYLYN